MLQVMLSFVHTCAVEITVLQLSLVSKISIIWTAACCHLKPYVIRNLCPEASSHGLQSAAVKSVMSSFMTDPSVQLQSSLVNFVQ